MKRVFLATASAAVFVGGIAAIGLSANAQEGVDPALMADGQDVYEHNCIGCHGAQGQGGAGPALAGNDVLSSGRAVAAQVLNGNDEHGMPAFMDALDDDEVAAVGTYIRNSWGNAFGVIVPETVAAQRPM